jgi:hypothetical protein
VTYYGLGDLNAAREFLERRDNEFEREALSTVIFVPLIGELGWSGDC